MNRFRSSERRLQLICRASRRQHRKSEIARQEKSWSVRKVCTARGTGRLGSKWQSIDLITRNCGLYLRKSLACCRLAWLEDTFEVRQLGRAKAQEIRVARRTMRDIEPQVELQLAFHHEPDGRSTDVEPDH